MLRATVIRAVWASRKLPDLPSGAFLEVEVADTGSRIVAFDTLGCGVGEQVLVVQGAVAAAQFPAPPPPIDALLIGSIDPPAAENATG
ncbi:EutN/CcmL family microcompartment protein [Actinomadura sp. 3N407]|uniref:EutN/CcmL family microcompartment protein n=1 Tax=Actinomadura sp. 3N407 TaxID=3457423 RepID=UPI003FCC7EEA